MSSKCSLSNTDFDRVRTYDDQMHIIQKYKQIN